MPEDMRLELRSEVEPGKRERKDVPGEGTARAERSLAHWRKWQIR